MNIQRKPLIAILAIDLLFIFGLSACGALGIVTTGSGNVVTREFDFTDFDEVSISHAFTGTITQGDAYRVVVRIDDNLVDKLLAEQDGSRINIGLESTTVANKATMEVDITLLKNVGPLGFVSDIPGMGQIVEKAVAYVPPFVYSHVTGIVSATGAEAEGWLISVGGTPKEMLAHPPEFTYSRLLEAAELSRRLGAQIMGLGAFTKVVGDAGVTVAKQARLPVTTGNSYSASGALWAAHEAVRRLGILPIDEDGIVHGKTMVVRPRPAAAVGQPVAPRDAVVRRHGHHRDGGGDPADAGRRRHAAV